jgi:hypothetical protein
MSIENFKVKMMWTCETCDKTIQKSSKNAHLKSQTHLKKAGKNPKDCELCCTASFEFKHCTQCVNSWCADCHNKIDKCPFCRKKIVGAPPRPVQWELGPEFLLEPRRLDFYEPNVPIRRSREPEIYPEIYSEIYSEIFFINQIRRLERDRRWQDELQYLRRYY